MKRYKTSLEEIKDMKKYVEKFKLDALENQLKAKEEAHTALYETGVLYKDGTKKEEIVIDTHL